MPGYQAVQNVPAPQNPYVQGVNQGYSQGQPQQAYGHAQQAYGQQPQQGYGQPQGYGPMEPVKKKSALAPIIIAAVAAVLVALLQPRFRIR